MKNQDKYRCADCGSTEVEYKAWVNLNTKEVEGDAECEDYWCANCETYADVLAPGETGEEVEEAV